MTKEDKNAYEKKIAELSEKEKKLRNLYLRKIALGELQGPVTGYPSLDKPWLKCYDEDTIKMDLPKMNAYRYLLNKIQENDVIK